MELVVTEISVSPCLVIVLGMISLSFPAAYEAYCVEMKAQLEAMKLENEALKRQGGTADADALELLSAMASLSVHCTNSGPLQRYSCSVIEGALKGDVMRNVRVTSFITYLHNRTHICFDFGSAHQRVHLQPRRVLCQKFKAGCSRFFLCYIFPSTYAEQIFY